MSAGVAPRRPVALGARPRRLLAASGLAAAVLACLPDLFGIGSGSEVAQTLWFALAALVAPALLVLGAPWTALTPGGSSVPPWLERLARARAASPGVRRSAGFLLVDLVVIVAWRMPALVDAVARHPVLVLAETGTLVLAGIGLWLELVDSPPLVARSSRPRRAVLAALAMWTVWTVAYLEGMSSTGWYHVFHHVAGSGLSAAADRQVSAVILWALAAAVFMPVVFWNLAQWLRTEAGADNVARPFSAGSPRRALGAAEASR